jgi:hypothetical protein
MENLDPELLDLDYISKGDTDWDARQNKNLGDLNQRQLEIANAVRVLQELLPVGVVFLLKDADNRYFPSDQIAP